MTEPAPQQSSGRTAPRTPRESSGGTTPRTPRGMSDEKPTVSDMQQVVVNDEEQYSLWPAGQEPPAGWRADGFTGSKQECLDHIDAVWTDMRPRSVRGREGASRDDRS